MISSPELSELWLNEKKAWESCVTAIKSQDQALVDAATRMHGDAIKNLKRYFKTDQEFDKAWKQHLVEFKTMTEQELWDNCDKAWRSLLLAFKTQDQLLVNGASKECDKAMKALKDHYKNKRQNSDPHCKFKDQDFDVIWENHCRENKAKRKDPNNIYDDL